MLEKDIEKILVSEVKKLGGRARPDCNPAGITTNVRGIENRERTAFSTTEGTD